MPDIRQITVDVSSLEPDERLRLIAQLWLSLPPDHWAAPTHKERAEIERRLKERDFDAVGDVSWRIADRMNARFGPPCPTVYSAPRRFDLATIFVVTSAYAILFGGFSALGAWPIVSVVIGGFITIVGIGQAVLFGGKKPRSASMLVGVILHAIIWIGAWIAYPRIYSATLVLFVTGYVVIGGVILGYCAGALVGSVFLVADILRRRYRWTSSHSPKIDQDATDGS
jgi:putative addiction module component (TIGR02574 family)